jgi:hypothetical protein
MAPAACGFLLLSAELLLLQLLLLLPETALKETGCLELL